MDIKDWNERWREAFCGCVAEVMRDADPGHGIDHVNRVVANAERLGLSEKGNPKVYLPAAWLHDCFLVPKNSPDRSKASRLAAARARELLTDMNYPAREIPSILHAIEAHSFSAGIPCQTVEAQIVQDADRLEALGAIGISRCLQTGGALGQRLYDPDSPFPIDREADDRLQSVDHFFAKLFQLPFTMQTHAGRIEADERIGIMVAFLKALCREIAADQVALQNLLDGTLSRQD